jgi:hypothetical protein
MLANHRVNDVYFKRANKYLDINQRGIMNLKAMEPKLSKMALQVNEDLADHEEGEKAISEKTKELETKYKKDEQKKEIYKKVEEKINRYMEKQETEQREYIAKKESLLYYRTRLLEVGFLLDKERKGRL